MATRNFLNAINKNHSIANEVIKYGVIQGTRKQEEFPAFMRRRSQESKQREIREAKYESRKNMCSNCFTAKAKDGSCFC